MKFFGSKLISILIALPIAFAFWLLLTAPHAQAAQSQFTPTSQNLITGTDIAIDSNAAASANGVNTGSWKGTLTDENLAWVVASTSSGLNAQLNVDNVVLNGANKMTIGTELKLSAAGPSIEVQICDWVSSTGVDDAADSQCTGGGWRTLNSRASNNTPINFTTTTSRALQWHIHDGYFTTGTTGGTAISTPLSNFVSNNSNKRVKIRYYSTANSTANVAIDYLRIGAFVDSIYAASGFTKTAGGTVTGTYTSTNPVFNTASAQGTVSSVDGGNNKVAVAAASGQVTEYYYSFKNIKTLASMNTILVRAEYNCSTASGAITPQIMNFDTSSWENLPTASITCSTSDASNAWAKNNIAVSDYLSSGEARVRFVHDRTNVGSSVDMIYLMVGSVNDDSSQCEISFGTGTATDCTNTRDLNMTGTASTFAVAAQDESTNMGTGEANSHYAFDNDMDVNAEEATASNISMPMELDDDVQVTGLNFAGRFSGCGATGAACGSPALTVQLGMENYSGIASTTGGWTAVGSTSATAAYAYTDSLTSFTASNYGLWSNPQFHIDTANNRMNLRLRTTAAGLASQNVTTNWDFAMVSLQWIEDDVSTHRYMFLPTSQNIVTGTEPAVNGQSATVSNGTVNMGSWKGAIADDGYHWVVNSTTSGIDVQLNVDGVNLNGANLMMVNTEIDLNVTAPSMKFQICDWVSSTSVDNAADAQCTGGGWRTLNSVTAADADVNFTGTSNTALQWHIYDGYFATGSTGGTAISTPLTNFISNDSNKRVKIRYYSTSNATSPVGVDWLRITPIINPIYSPSAVTKISGNNFTGTYLNAIPIGNTATAQRVQTGGSSVYLALPGTAGSISDFYFTFKNVKTYEDANTIYIKATYSCSAGGINHRGKIYNFSTSSWEDLGNAAIACGTTQTTNAFAVNNIDVSDYINGIGEIRVGWYGSANSTIAIRISQLFVMIGTTNTDTGWCEVSFGSGTSSSCSQTRTIDETAIPNGSDFDNPAEDESTNMGTGESNSYYPYDTTHDTTANEGSSSNIGFNITQPEESIITSIHFASRMYSGATTIRTQPGFRDESGIDQTTGGWTQVGTIATPNAIQLTDSVSAATANAYGLLLNPEDHYNTNLGRVNMRMRTTTAAAAAVNSVTSWDFAMASLAWIEPNAQPLGSVTISGTCKEYDQTTDCSYGSRADAHIAINGVLNPNSGTITSGAWSIEGLTGLSEGDVITVFVDGVSDANEAVAVTKYSGTGDINSVKLIKEHITVGSNQNTTVNLSDMALYDYSDDEDIYFEATSYSGNCNGLNGTHAFCADFAGVSTNEVLYIDNGDTLSIPSGAVILNKLQVEGTYLSGASSLVLVGSGNGTTCGTTNQMPVCVGSSGTYDVPFAVNYRYTAITTILAESYQYLTVSAEGTAAATLGAGTFNITGSFIMDACSNRVFDGATYHPTLNFIDNGYLDIGNSCGATFNAGTSIINFSSASNNPLQITGTSVFNANTSTVTFSGNNIYGDVNIPAATYYNLTLNNASETFVTTGDLTVNNNLTVTAGTFTGTNNVTVTRSTTGDGIINFTAGTFRSHTNTAYPDEFGGNSDWSFYDLTVGYIYTGGLPPFQLEPAFSPVGSGSITITNVFTITDNGGDVGLGSKNWNLTGSGTPFVRGSGSVDFEDSTFTFSGSSATNIAAAEYNNLALAPGANDVTYTMIIGGYWNYVLPISGDLTLGKDTVTGTIIDSNTNDISFTVGGDMTIAANTTFSASDTNALTIAGDFTNNGTFTHNNGSVVIDTAAAGTNTIGGSSNTAFYNFANTDPGSTLKFAAGKTYSFAGTLSLNGAGGSKTNLQSTANGEQWLATLTGTASLSQLNVKDSGCSESNTMPSSQTITNQGNNGACWIFLGSLGVGSGNAPVDNGTPGGSGGTSGGEQDSGNGGGGDEGYQSHTAGTVVNDNSVGTVAWTGLDQTTASDFGFARVFGTSGFTSNFIKFTNFGFNVPAGATITGIKARIQKWHNNYGSSQDLTVKLVVDGTITGDNYANLGQNWPYSLPTMAEHGGMTDLWGITPTLTPEQINASDFGLAVSVYSDSVTEGSSTGIDYLELVVYYDYHDENGPGGSGGESGGQSSSSTKGAGAGTNDTSVGSVEWLSSTLSNITASDDTTVTSSGGYVTEGYSNYLKATNFGFSIPSGAVVNGISAMIRRFRTDGTNTYDNSVRLVVGGGVVGSEKAKTSDVWQLWSFDNVSYGSESDLWGLSLTPADVNASNFGIAISARMLGDGDNFPVDASVDFVTLTVYYTDPPPPSGGGGASP